MATSSDNKFSPAWWLPGPHAQTLWSQFFRRTPRLAFRSERLGTPDGDVLELRHHDVPGASMRLLILHGLEGSANSHYVAGIASRAARRGWSASVLVFRGCGDELNLGARLYHSGETTDVGFALDVLRSREPDVRLSAVGISLGGNVLLKLLGEQGAAMLSRLSAAAAVSVPFDLEAGCRNLQRGFPRIYDRHFLRRLRRKAMRKLEQHPGLFDASRLARARTIEDFDEVVTAPVHGFAGSHDYYTRSSSIHFLPRIRVRTLLLSSADDPFLPRASLDEAHRVASANPALTVHFTDAGGHVGFLAGHIPFRPQHWGEDRIIAFIDSNA